MIVKITAKHAIITPVCIKNRSAQEAFEEAIRRLREEYNRIVGAPINAQANFHLKLEVEREVGK